MISGINNTDEIIRLSVVIVGINIIIGIINIINVNVADGVK